MQWITGLLYTAKRGTYRPGIAAHGRWYVVVGATTSVWTTWSDLILMDCYLVGVSLEQAVRDHSS